MRKRWTENESKTDTEDDRENQIIIKRDNSAFTALSTAATNKTHGRMITSGLGVNIHDQIHVPLTVSNHSIFNTTHHGDT